jgi:GAF domain-containing protein
VLTIERLGTGNTFSFDEFELVQLFAAQVSIALQNAEVFQAVQVRAQDGRADRAAQPSRPSRNGSSASSGTGRRSA